MKQNESIGERLMATGLNAVYAAMERPHQKYDDHQYDDIVREPEGCECCIPYGKPGALPVANGPDDYEWVDCWYCNKEVEDAD